jgi:hypothetical protein
MITAHALVQKNINVLLPAKFNIKVAPITATQFTPMTRAVAELAPSELPVSAKIVDE